ncbi:winged helix DNA-binding protein [Paenibacillus sp. KN14-4R]|uniref:winged helix DNA-binding protein n=1 Tax=Paenibacillus sp. KN14-4R TaxID=3445773 RepID=UPI003F9F7F6E
MTKDLLIKELMETTMKLQQRFQAEDDEEKRWLMENSSSPAVAQFLKESTVMMLHIIDAIGRLEPVNGITISKQFGIPKGSVSKITRKLIEQQIIRTENLPDNKKEILFCTTPLGKEIFHLHQALHRKIDIGVNQFLQRYDENELRFIIRCLKDTLEASWIHTEEPELEKGFESSLGETSGRSGRKSVRSDGNAEEMNEIVQMLQTLDGRDLKKAKAILKNVFFTEFEG